MSSFDLIKIFENFYTGEYFLKYKQCYLFLIVCISNVLKSFKIILIEKINLSRDRYLQSDPTRFDEDKLLKKYQKTKLTRYFNVSRLPE